MTTPRAAAAATGSAAAKAPPTKKAALKRAGKPLNTKSYNDKTQACGLWCLSNRSYVWSNTLPGAVTDPSQD